MPKLFRFVLWILDLIWYLSFVIWHYLGFTQWDCHVACGSSQWQTELACFRQPQPMGNHLPHTCLPSLILASKCYYITSEGIINRLRCPRHTIEVRGHKTSDCYSECKFWTIVQCRTYFSHKLWGRLSPFKAASLAKIYDKGDGYILNQAV